MTATDSDAFAEVDRFIEALKEPVASGPYVVTYSSLLRHLHGDEHEQASRGALARVLRALRMRGPLVEGPRDLERLAAGQERQVALQALAIAALERVKTQTAEELADRLEQFVEELEESRQQAVQVEGDREPDDPYSILQILPDEYHQQFLNDYRGALRAAYPAEGYLALQRMLKRWRKAAEALSDPAYQAEAERSLQAAETGDFTGYTRMDEVFRRSSG